MTQYIHIIGSLMYLTNTRKNICFSMNTLSQYLVKLRWVHLIGTKHVMRYLKGTRDFGLYYVRDIDYRLYGYTDWDGIVSERKRTLGGCYCIVSSMISWFSRKQSSVSLNTTEAKYIYSLFC